VASGTSSKKQAANGALHHLAGIGTKQVAETTYRAAVARWPAALVLVQIKMLDGYSLSSLSRSGASTEPRYVFASEMMTPQLRSRSVCGPQKTPGL
jgi:hypothetical protein